jgi:hypothetical protein
MCTVAVSWLNQPSAKALMRALDVVVKHVFSDELSQVRLAERVSLRRG